MFYYSMLLIKSFIKLWIEIMFLYNADWLNEFLFFKVISIHIYGKKVSEH